MAKAVFRPGELTALPEKIVLESPTLSSDLAHQTSAEETDEDKDKVEEYTGPTADDLRREAEEFKVQWEEEKTKMISDANTEAANVVEDARQKAQQEITRSTDEARVIKQNAEDEAGKIISEAKAAAVQMEEQVRQSLDGELKEARDKGREEGHEAGFSEGKAEVDRLIQRTQRMLERAQDKRAEILAETEQEIVDLVLLIARKVIKVISENQRNIVVSNVVQALRKVKARGNVMIRVNMTDLGLATEHKQSFIQMLEGVKSVQVVEDSSVDSGGCIIETDFGEIDARISSQLAELESKILDISPMKAKIKNVEAQPKTTAARPNGLAALAREGA
ncbi:MAG: flagellar assembly protein FliH [Treponema sp.]|jgi:flagellar assembly protein FliH|nr:flagellar assembly protein FliH [Treponema sp.]